MNIKIYKLHWWTVAFVVLGFASLMALGNHMSLEQEASVSQSDDPTQQRELKKEVRNRQSMYVLLGVTGISLVVGIAAAVRRREQNGEDYAGPDISVTVKNGYLRATGHFQRLELWKRNGEAVCSTTQQTLNLTHIRHGKFILNVHTDKGEFSRMLHIEKYNEVREGLECWSKSRIAYKGKPRSNTDKPSSK